MAMPDAAWRSLLETHLANLRSHRAVLDHMVSLFSGGSGDPATAELEAMRGRAERIWEDAVRAGELLENVRGRTPAETPTPSKPRRISSGAEVSRAGTPILEHGDEDEEEGLEEGGGTSRDTRIVMANIPQGASEKHIRQHMRAYRPIRLTHHVRLPKKSEIHIYDLPVHAHGNGLVKIELATTSIAARAAREMDGSRLDPRSQEVLIVCRYRDGAVTEKTVKKRHRVSSGQHILPQRGSKRQRTDETPTVETTNMPDIRNGISSEQRAPSPFVFTAGPAEPMEQEPEFEDITAEVEARLAEQAARRAAAKQKASGPTVGKKRKRSSGASTGDAEAEGVEEGIKGMMLVDGRPKKRAREEVVEDGGGGEARTDAGRPQENGFPKSKARTRKERRKERQKEGEEDGRVEESPRPMKRSRVSSGEGAP